MRLRRRARHASLRRRAVAQAVDTAVGGTVMAGAIAGVAVRAARHHDPGRRPSRAALSIGVYGVWLLAHLVARRAYGTQSLGMAAAGVRLVTEDGRPASLARWYVRGQGLRLGTWPIRRVLATRARARWRLAEALATLLVEAVVVIVRDDNRSIGDLMAGTTVVEAPRR